MVKINKYLGYGFISIITYFTILSSYASVTSATNTTAINSQVLAYTLSQKFPKNTMFHLYDWGYRTTNISLPVALYLTQDNKISDLGINVGISNTTAAKGQVIDEEKKIHHEYLFNLVGFNKNELNKYQWISVTPLSIYNSVENWYIK